VKKLRIIIIVIIVVTVVAAGIGAAFWHKIKGGNKSETVRIENAKRGELIEFVSAPGEIEPKTNVEISAKVSARIIKLPYEEGDTVTCGDPNANPPIPASILVRLDSKDLETRLTSAEAGRAAQVAQAEVEKARIASQNKPSVTWNDRKDCWNRRTSPRPLLTRQRPNTTSSIHSITPPNIHWNRPN
jgi:HlyD family secretion protein